MTTPQFRDPAYYLARLRLLEESLTQFLLFLPDEAAIGISAEYTKRLKEIELLFPEALQSLILTRPN